MEANWRMFQFQTFDVKPAVLRLTVHLEI